MVGGRSSSNPMSDTETPSAPHENFDRVNFLELRNARMALQEIRDYAQVMENFFHEAMPVTWDAFNANERVAP